MKKVRKRMNVSQLLAKSDDEYCRMLELACTYMCFPE